MVPNKRQVYVKTPGLTDVILTDILRMKLIGIGTQKGPGTYLGATSY